MCHPPTDYAHLLGGQDPAPAAELEESEEPQPAEDEPCTPGWCSTHCWHEEGTGFVYETQRGGGGYAVEDVQAYCLCDHHGALRPRY